jgi:hypothetical protein
VTAKSKCGPGACPQGHQWKGQLSEYFFQLSQPHRTGSWAWTTSLPSDKESSQPMPDLLPYVGAFQIQCIPLCPGYVCTSLCVCVCVCVCVCDSI